MVVQVTVGRKPLSAYLIVSHPVVVHVTAGSKLLPAYLIVSHPVVVHVTAGSKLLPAYLIVSHPVVVQVTAGCKPLPAYPTLMRLFPAVNTPEAEIIFETDHSNDKHFSLSSQHPSFHCIS
jgi:hypothetical protein